MKPEQIEGLRGLLREERLLALSLLVDGDPYAGLLPYAPAPDLSAVLVHASDLARHTRGLRQGAPFSILIHRPDGADGDPLQIERVTLQGAVEVLERGSEDYQEGRLLYLQRFPSSESTFLLGDFNLYRLRFEKGRYVAGFAQAVNLTRRNLKQLA